MESYRRVDLNLLLVLDALLRAGNVTRAAQSLGVTPSAVSKALGKLRAHFGDELFLKTSDGVAPTATCLALAEDVRAFVQAADTAMNARRRFDPSTAGRQITICISDVGEVHLMPTLLSRLEANAPGCRTRVVQAGPVELREGLAEGQIDLVVTPRMPAFADVLQQKVHEDSFGVVADAQSDLDGGIDAAEFSRRQHVVVIGQTNHSDEVERFLVSRGLRRDAAHATSHWLAIPHLLRGRPQLIAVWPLRLAEIYSGEDLKLLEPSFELPRIEVVQAWHRRVNSDPFNVWLRGEVREAMNEIRASRNRRRQALEAQRRGSTPTDPA